MGSPVMRSGPVDELTFGSDASEPGLRLVGQRPLSPAANDSKVQHPATYADWTRPVQPGTRSELDIDY
jgi:hypothetical protein